jgi:hypothetical protein
LWTGRGWTAGASGRDLQIRRGGYCSAKIPIFQQSTGKNLPSITNGIELKQEFPRFASR